MKNTSPASELIAAVSRRSFFGRAAVAGSAVLLGSSIPSKVGAEDKKDKKEDQEKNEKKGKKEEESQCGSPGLCDFPVPIPHINTPPPGGVTSISRDPWMVQKCCPSIPVARTPKAATLR